VLSERFYLETKHANISVSLHYVFHVPFVDSLDFFDFGVGGIQCKLLIQVPYHVHT
jgi:hypothetical protein